MYGRCAYVAAAAAGAVDMAILMRANMNYNYYFKMINISFRHFDASTMVGAAGAAATAAPEGPNHSNAEAMIVGKYSHISGE